MTTISVQLTSDSDPETNAVVTLTYGLRTAVGNITVLPAGTALPHIGNGVYSLDVTSYVTPGTAYETNVKVVHADGSIDYDDRPFTVPDVEPAGYYGTLADLYSKAGKRNVWAYADLDVESPDALSTAAATRLQQEMNQADAEINHYLRMNGVTAPVGTGDSGFALLNEAWRYWVLSKSYSARGDRDFTLTDLAGNTRPINTKSGDWEKRANLLLAKFVMGRRRNISASVAFTGQNRAGYHPCG